MNAHWIKRGLLIYIGLAFLPEIARALGWALPFSIGIASSVSVNALAASGVRFAAMLAIGWALFAGGRALWRRRR